MQIPYIDHVAILVGDVNKAEKALPLALNRGQVEEFISEGTREQYLYHPKQSGGAVLLMQPTGEGPYNRALKKRGQGLHHICIRVKQIESYLEEISQTGFLLHPCSIRTFKHKTVYLCRPGINFLVEVEEFNSDQNSAETSGLINAIGLPLAGKEIDISQKLLGKFIYKSEEPTLSFNLSPNEFFSIKSLKSS